MNMIFNVAPIQMYTRLIEQYIYQTKKVRVKIKLPLTTPKEIELFEKLINKMP